MDETLQELLRKAAAALKDAGAKEVYVFGSAARGELDEYSDVDLAVLGLPPGVLFDAMGIASDVLKRQVDLIRLDRPNPFTDYLKRKGKLIRVA